MVSIVIIGKNESKNIIECISSIKLALKDLEHEILFIDSNSSDNTAQLAAMQGAKTYILKEKKTTPALGRFIGTKLSKGEFILFLDSDMRLCDGFVEEALIIMEDRNYDGACGIRNDIYYKDGKVYRKINNYFNMTKIRKARLFGGAIFIKKSILDMAGGWSPSISTYEEAELHSRLDKCNAKIVEIPVPMIIHHDRSAYVRSLKDIILSKRRIGIGEAFMSSIKSDSLFYFIKRERLVFLCMGFDLFSIIMILPFAVSFGWYSILIHLLIQLMQFTVLCLFKNPRIFITAKLSNIYLPIGMMKYEKKSLDFEEVKM